MTTTQTCRIHQHVSQDDARDCAAEQRQERDDVRAANREEQDRRHAARQAGIDLRVEHGADGYRVTGSGLRVDDGTGEPVDRLDELYRTSAYVRTALAERHGTEAAALESAESLARWLRQHDVAERIEVCE